MKFYEMTVCFSKPSLTWKSMMDFQNLSVSAAIYMVYVYSKLAWVLWSSFFGSLLHFYKNVGGPFTVVCIIGSLMAFMSLQRKQVALKINLFVMAAFWGGASLEYLIRPLMDVDEVIGFKQSHAGHCLFIFHQDTVSAFLLVYVDDIVLTGNEDKLLLLRRFKIKDLGQIHYLLGIEVIPTSTGVHLHQQKYIIDLLKEANLTHAHQADTPMEMNIKLDSKNGHPFVTLTLTDDCWVA